MSDRLGPVAADQGAADEVAANPYRFRLSRAGVVNVWQYDEQVFEFAEGRMLLRGANGAGKSKTLEMLLPFVLDGDKQRMTASGRHHTSLLWLMTDGHEGNRTGYLWVEFARHTEDGERELFTCGVGVRASSSAKTATNWFFTTSGQVGVDLSLEDDAGPLPKDRLRAALGPEGQLFEQTRAYRQHIGRHLFGLEPGQYDELLRLLYWLRQPQVGEDIEPARLADQLGQALPQVDEAQLRSAGDAFDELVAFGEQLDRRQRAAEAVAALAESYAGYAVAVSRERGEALLQASRELSRRSSAVTAAARHRDEVGTAVETARDERQGVERDLGETRARLRALETGPEARTHQRLLEIEQRAQELAADARRQTDAVQRSVRRAEQSARRVEADRDGLRHDLTGVAGEGQALAAEVMRLAPTAVIALPAELATADLQLTPARIGAELSPDQPRDASPDVTELRAALGAHASAMGSLRPVLGELLAAVEVVDQARGEADTAASRRDAEQRRAAEAEQRAEQERGRHADAVRAATAAEHAFVTALRRWAQDPLGAPFDLPELTASTVTALPAQASAAARPDQGRLQADAAEAAAERVQAERSLTELRQRRATIEAERDPAPPTPALPRSERADLAGAPLWRLIDFAEGLDDAQRAGLEAALEASGLLDAWVQPDGAVLDAARLDVVLAVGPAVAGPTLADALVCDLGADQPAVPVEIVRSVLARIGLGERAVTDPGAEGSAAEGSAVLGSAALDVTGRWRLGPLVGRAAKATAQYVGAGARIAERVRRLREVDAQIDRVERGRLDAAAREQRAATRLGELEAWLAALPPSGELLAAWVRLEERLRSAERADADARAADESAATARGLAAAARRWLDDLAAAHGLPATAAGLASRREQLRDLDRRLAAQVQAAAPLEPRLRRWAQDRERWRDEVAETEQLADNSGEARLRAEAEAATARELRDTAGAGIAELHQRLAAARADIETGVRRQRDLEARLQALHEQLGGAQSAWSNDTTREQEQQPVVAAGAAALAALAEVPGLLRSALDRDLEAVEVNGFQLAAGSTGQGRLPGPVTELARVLAALPEPRRRSDAAALFAALQGALASDGAEHEPRITPVADDLLGAFGRDDGGEHPVAVLAGRLAVAVARDRELLTDRERTQFEEHLVGELGDELRRRRLEAHDLVAGMNQLLAGVTTSQGIAVRLDWRLRDDVADDVRRAVTLLGQPVGALLPGERAELRDSLHRLIDASRAEAPEDSYTEHLTRALDYRGWFAFRIRYTRPELDGRWQELHRRSPLSQGEQKVVCYLPLFAAAAAHFTSLAGAAPHAPRFILLDDAFPKIDVRTHALLFGLLVDLDLDFVVTSERLWGDHPTVPSLAIYEALRDPSERGIAQYRYHWDGARLAAVGA